MFYYKIMCFSMSNYLNAYKQFLFIFTVALLNVFKFYWLSDTTLISFIFYNWWKLNIYMFGK